MAAPDLMGSDPKLAPVFAAESVAAVRRFMATLQPGRMRDQSYQQQELAKLPEGERAAVGRFYSVAFGGALPYGRFLEELSSTHAHLAEQPSVSAEDRQPRVCFGGSMSAGSRVPERRRPAWSSTARTQTR